MQIKKNKGDWVIAELKGVVRTLFRGWDRPGGVELRRGRVGGEIEPAHRTGAVALEPHLVVWPEGLFSRSEGGCG